MPALRRSLEEYPSTRAIVRVVLTAIVVVVALYLLYLLKKPIGFLVIAMFLAVALSGPVNALQRVMPRGFAIAVVYLALLAVPVAIGSVVVPPVVNGADDLARNAPAYAKDVTTYVQGNKRLAKLNRDYSITQKLEQEASKLPSRLGDAAGVLRDVGFGLVNSVFSLVTILLLAAFMLGGGKRWIDTGLRYFGVEQAARIERVLARSATAVGNYVAGALFQASLAGVLSYAVLKILGVPFAAPLALLIFFLDLIPLVGATIGAVAVGVVTLFQQFPTDTIIWVVWSIVYQQLENNLLQPQIQRRAVDINPFLVVVSVLCGGTLLGVLGALVAVPVAASIQIALREYADLRGITPRDDGPSATGPDPPAPGGGEAEPAPA